MKRVALAVLLALAPSAACQGEEPSATVDVRLWHEDVAAAPDRVGPGLVRFDAHNVGEVPHELVVLRTGLPADDLPVVEGRVVVRRRGVRKVVETEVFPAGERRSVETELASGEYVLICNVPGHYQLGMRSPFRVG